MRLSHELIRLFILHLNVEKCAKWSRPGAQFRHLVKRSLKAFGLDFVLEDIATSLEINPDPIEVLAKIDARRSAFSRIANMLDDHMETSPREMGP